MLADLEAAERLAEASEMLVNGRRPWKRQRRPSAFLAQIAWDAADAPAVDEHVRPRRRARSWAPALRRARAGALAGRAVPDARRQIRVRSIETGDGSGADGDGLGLDVLRADALATVGTARGVLG